MSEMRKTIVEISKSEEEGTPTPPRTIFTDYPAAYLAIQNQNVEGFRIPSPSPGMETMVNPFAKLPYECHEIPRTSPHPIKPTPSFLREGGSAAEEIKLPSHHAATPMLSAHFENEHENESVDMGSSSIIPAVAGPSLGSADVMKANAASRRGKIPWFGQNGDISVRDISQKELRQLQSSSTEVMPDTVNQGANTGNLLLPLTYQSSSAKGGPTSFAANTMCQHEVDFGSGGFESSSSGAMGPHGKFAGGESGRGLKVPPIGSGFVRGSDDLFLVRDDEQDDGDWESMRGDSAQKEPSFACEQSLANMSSCGSLVYPTLPWDPLSKSTGSVLRLADQDLPHAHYMREDVENGRSVVVPEYDELTRGRLLSKNALSLQRPSFAANPQPRFIPKSARPPTYKHPVPLGDDHVHPFSSSPPAIEHPEGCEAIQMGILKPMHRAGTQTPADNDHRDSNEKQTPYAIDNDKDQITVKDGERSSQFSNQSVDGSYGCPRSESGASVCSVLTNSLQLPRSGGTFSKATVLGVKSNITGALNGTGARIVGSSSADFSTDQATMTTHDRGQLALNDGRQMVDDVNKTVYSSGLEAPPNTPVTPVKLTFPVPHSTVTTKDGYLISGPKQFVAPQTIPGQNSFTLQQKKRLTITNCDEAEIEERIMMANDDMIRLKSDCPMFPLRDDHLEDKFLLNGRETDSPCAFRSETLLPDGRYFEQAYCFTHNRWEFSHAPTLTRSRRNQDSVQKQREVGRAIVKRCIWYGWVLFVGWILLPNIATNSLAARDLIRFSTNGEIPEFHEEERALARKACEVIKVCFLLFITALFAVTVYLIFHY